MKSSTPSYRGHRFPREIIRHAVWLYLRFCLSFRDVEDLLAERGVTVTYETIRQWCRKFGTDYARTLKRREGRLGDTWFLDEIFVTIQGKRQYLWRAVDQDGDVIDILVQPRRDRRAAERFFRTLLKGQGIEPRRLVTDKLRSYSATRQSTMPSVAHDTTRHTQQPSGGLPPADTAAGTTDAPFQVARPSATFPLRSRSHPEPVPHGAAPRQLREPPYASRAFLPRLEGDVCLLNPSRPAIDRSRSRLDQGQVDSTLPAHYRA
jgi:putative transposase